MKNHQPIQNQQQKHISWLKVAVIILNYNNWQDTIECLESVLRNDYPNYQVIFVDNGSPNNSMEYIKAWAEGRQEVFNFNLMKQERIYFIILYLQKRQENVIINKKLAKKFDNLIFVGRLAEYRYYDMDDAVKKALEVFEKKNEVVK